MRQPLIALRFSMSTRVIRAVKRIKINRVTEALIECFRKREVRWQVISTVKMVFKRHLF